MSVGERGVEAADGRLRVFISSSAGELAEERQAVRSAVRTLRLTPVLSELGAAPEAASPEQCDVFVGVYWQSYGWTSPDAQVSGLEDEYRRDVRLAALNILFDLYELQGVENGRPVGQTLVEAGAVRRGDRQVPVFALVVLGTH